MLSHDIFCSANEYVRHPDPEVEVMVQDSGVVTLFRPRVLYTYDCEVCGGICEINVNAHM